MEKPKDHPKQQHYVPRIYLVGFGDDRGFVGQYDLALETRYIPPQDPRKVGKQNKLYDFETHEGEWGTGEYALGDLDGMFSRAIVVVDGLVDAALDAGAATVVLPDGVRSDLACFIAAQVVRVPSVKAMKMGIAQRLNNAMSDYAFSQEKFVRGLHRRLADQGSTLALEDIRGFLSTFQVPASGKMWIDHIHAATESLADCLRAHTWTLRITTGQSRFITSDRPVLYLNEADEIVSDFSMGFEGEGHDKVIPLSGRISLRMAWADPPSRPSTSVRVQRLDDQAVADVNVAQARFFERKLFGRWCDIERAVGVVEPDPDDRPPVMDGAEAERYEAIIQAAAVREIAAELRQRTQHGRRRPRRRQGHRARKA